MIRDMSYNEVRLLYHSSVAKGDSKAPRDGLYTLRDDSWQIIIGYTVFACRKISENRISPDGSNGRTARIKSPLP